jgi:hypothetical protein
LLKPLEVLKEGGDVVSGGLEVEGAEFGVSVAFAARYFGEFERLEASDVLGGIGAASGGGVGFGGAGGVIEAAGVELAEEVVEPAALRVEPEAVEEELFSQGEVLALGFEAQGEAGFAG